MNKDDKSYHDMDRLNVLIERVEKHLSSLKPVTRADVSLSPNDEWDNRSLRYGKINNRWGLYVVNSDDTTTRLTDTSIETRLAAVSMFGDLKRQLIMSNNELRDDIAVAIKGLEIWLHNQGETL